MSKLENLISDMEEHHGGWRYISRDPDPWSVFTTLPERALEFLKNPSKLLDLHWETSLDGKHCWLFAGASEVELVWLEKRKVQWSAVCWLPQCNIGKTYNTLAGHQKHCEEVVRHWFERALSNEVPSVKHEETR